METEHPVLGGSLRCVHSHTHLLVGIFTDIFHHQSITAWPRHCHLKLDVHLGEGRVTRGPWSSSTPQLPIVVLVPRASPNKIIEEAEELRESPSHQVSHGSCMPAPSPYNLALDALGH